jgi:hypothetical protein
LNAHKNEMVLAGDTSLGFSALTPERQNKITLSTQNYREKLFQKNPVDGTFVEPVISEFFTDEKTLEKLDATSPIEARKLRYQYAYAHIERHDWLLKTLRDAITHRNIADAKKYLAEIEVDYLAQASKLYDAADAKYATAIASLASSAEPEPVPERERKIITPERLPVTGPTQNSASNNVSEKRAPRIITPEKIPVSKPPISIRQEIQADPLAQGMIRNQGPEEPADAFSYVYPEEFAHRGNGK